MKFGIDHSDGMETCSKQECQLWLSKFGNFNIKYVHCQSIPQNNFNDSNFEESEVSSFSDDW